VVLNRAGLRSLLRRSVTSPRLFTSNELIEFTARRRCARLPATDPQANAAPRFSIVMPSYNHGSLIEKSLLSVINQQYPNLELIVMDGGSSDGTRAVLERYDADITLWRSEHDDGQSDALNKGFKHATGEIYGWLNSDDIYCPGAFEFAAGIFRSRPEVQVVYGDWYTLGLDNRISAHYFCLPYSRRQLITEGFFCNAQAMFWRRRLHKRFGEFDERLHYTMDYELILRLATLAGPSGFYRTRRPLGCFRVYPGQKTGAEAAVDRVASEHRLIAQKENTTWKYRPSGRAIRLLYRAKRVRDYVLLGGAPYVMWKLGLARNPVEGI
jgi:glycosyltransferase involved in cell wall biosynthesis